MAKKKPATPAQPEIISGPCKARPAVPPPPRYTTHKTRARWFQARAAYPVREANVDHLTTERRRFRPVAAPATGLPAWQLIGPANIGGRTTSIAVHLSNPDIVYIGTAGGGVWRSDDAGQTWTSQWYSQPVLNIGSLAIDPKSPDTIYAGTGEANLSADSYGGVGLFRSQNGGKTWFLLAPSKTSGLRSRRSRETRD